MSITDEIDEMIRLRAERAPSIAQMKAWKAEIEALRTALEPFTKLGGPNDGVMPAYHDLEDDVVVYANSGECITAGDVRAARTAFGILHAPRRRSDISSRTGAV